MLGRTGNEQRLCMLGRTGNEQRLVFVCLVGHEMNSVVSSYAWQDRKWTLSCLCMLGRTGNEYCLVFVRLVGQKMNIIFVCLVGQEWILPPCLSGFTSWQHRTERWWSRASCPRMSVDILGTNCDQCRSTVQYCFTSTETIRLVRTNSPGRPPRLSHSSWTLTGKAHCVRLNRNGSTAGLLLMRYGRHAPCGVRVTTTRTRKSALWC